MINDIIETLVSTRNIFKLIELSKKYPEIKLKDYFDYIPSININFSPIDPKINGNGFKSYSITQITSFRLKGIKKTFYSKEYFLQNINDVIEIKINDWVFKVKDGKYYASYSENFFSIEFSLSCLSGYALENKKNEVQSYYCIDERLVSEEQYKNILRIMKLNEITNQEFQSSIELVTILENKLRDKYIDEREKKIAKEREKISEKITINYFPYNVC